MLSRTLRHRPISFDNFKREQNLSYQMSLIILNVTESFLINFNNTLKRDKCKDDNSILKQIFQILIDISKVPECYQFEKHFFYVLTCFLEKYSNVIYNINNEILSNLCLFGLMKSISSNVQTRAISNTFLYLILRNGYVQGQNFNKIKIQMIIGFSKLMGKIDQIDDDDHSTKHTLHLLPLLLNNDTYFVNKMMKDNFTKALNEHLSNLTNIMKDSLQLRRHRSDPEMTCDLLYNIATQYKNAPELRITWLENLVQYNVDNNFLTEAGYAMIHLAAMISEYLSKLRPNDHWLPRGCMHFAKATETVLEEETTLSNKEIKSLCQSSKFSEANLYKIITDAVGFLKNEQLYETINEIYKMILPIFEYRFDYKRISTIHNDIKKCYDDLIELQFFKQKRNFSIYWRIGFYGLKFNEMNNTEFIYKEKFGTTLGEIKERLFEQYQQIYGSNNVEIFTTSSAIDLKKIKGKMKNGKVFLQITKVDPYFNEKELLLRRNNFQKMNNISQFTFQIPFTKEVGKKSQGTVQNQWLKKIILTVDGQFPYVKKRLKVIERNEHELNPLQVSLYSIKEKNLQLKNELSKYKKDSKNLQGLLQGTLLITVNQGPFAICKAFLGRNIQNYDTALVEDLRLEFKQFLDLLKQAVHENSFLIENEMKLFQTTIENGIKELKERVAPYLIEGGPSEEVLKHLERAELDNKNISMKIQENLTSEKLN